MIGWIALIMAADAESKAGSANNKARAAKNKINEIAGDPFVIVQPFELEEVSSAPKNASFWKHLFSCNKLVLEKKPFAKWSVRRSDIRDLSQRYDADGKPYVKVCTSSEYRNFRIPGTLERVTAVLNGTRKKK